MLFRMSADAWAAIFGGIPAVFTVVLAVTAVCALVYAIKQLRQARDSERVQHLLRFVEQFDTPPFADIRRSLAAKRLQGDDDPPELENILDFFETIGLLVRRDFLDAHDVWCSFSYWIFSVFSDFRDFVEQEQKDDPTYYRDFTSLVERLREIEKSEHGTSDRPSKEEIEEFWGYESKLTAGSTAMKRRPRRSVKKKGNDKP